MRCEDCGKPLAYCPEDLCPLCMYCGQVRLENALKLAVRLLEEKTDELRSLRGLDRCVDCGAPILELSVCPAHRDAFGQWVTVPLCTGCYEIRLLEA